MMSLTGVQALLLKKESSRRRSWRPWRCTTSGSAKLYTSTGPASIFTLPSRIDLQGMLPFCCDCYLEGMPLGAYKNTSARSRACSWRSRRTSRRATS